MDSRSQEAPRSAAADSRLFLLVILAALFLLAIQAYHFFPFIADDAFISLRYSQRLIAGKGLTWSDGQRVEGYTNLLWVLICAAFGRLGFDLVHVARVLGVVSTLSAFAALVTYLRENIVPARRPMAAVCSLIPFALSSGIAVWMIGALEQSLLIGLLGWVLVCATRYLQTGNRGSLLSITLLLACITLTRADGFIFGLMLFAALALQQRMQNQSTTPAFIVLIGPAIAYLSQLIFRLHYYHEWVPNSAYVKVSFTIHRLLTGAKYMVVGSLAEFALIILAVLGCVQLWRTPRGRDLCILFVLPVVGICSYLILVGGDIFPALRHLVPVILILCFAAAHASFFAFTSTGTLRTGMSMLLLALAMLTAVSRYQAKKAYTERWEWQNKQLGLYIKQHFPQNAILVSDAAGATPYYSELDAIDPLGLNDLHIAHLGSREKGKGLIGHELGDGKYVLDHQPDIIMFGTSGEAKPSLLSDYLIFYDPRFKPEYELQHWKFDKPTPWVSDVYVRRSHR